MTTLLALPTVSGIGRAKSREEPPAVPEFYKRRTKTATESEEVEMKT